jgi:uncharacterized membrane protein
VRSIVRSARALLVGALLALFLAFATLFVIVPVVGRGGLWLAQIVAVLVFAAVMVFIIRSVLRAYRSSGAPNEAGKP